MTKTLAQAAATVQPLKPKRPKKKDSRKVLQRSAQQREKRTESRLADWQSDQRNAEIEEFDLLTT